MLEGILSISGQPGLYKIISQTKNGIIVESLETKKRQPVYSNSKVSALEDIAIFTTGEEIPLFDVLKKIYTVENKAATSVSKNSKNEEIKDYFEDILPEYDKERVYISDMKKVLNWYNTLLGYDLLNFDKEEKATEAIAPVEEIEEKEVKVKPVASSEETAVKVPKVAKVTKEKEATTTTGDSKTKKAPAAKKAK